MKRRSCYFYLACIAALTSINFTGCQRSAKEDSLSGFEIFDQEERTTEFSIEKYADGLETERVPISGYGSQYQSEADRVAKSEYETFDYSDCTFQDFPDIEEMEIMGCQVHGITVQESWDTIEKWLEKIGKADRVDMKKEVRVVSPQLGLDENDEYFLFYDYMDQLESGEGAFITNSLCHMQIAENGIYSMSDGKITEYLGYTTKTSRDALGSNQEETVEEGPYSVMKDKTYELIDGELSVQEAAELVRDFFLAGTPFPCEENVTVDIPEVRVFQLGDVYGYDLMVRRIYRSVPFAYTDYGYRQKPDMYSLSGDIKHAYVVDSSGVTAFAGYNESEKLVSLASGDQFIGVEQMAEKLSTEMAASIDIHVKSVGLTYLPISFSNFESSDERVVLPCWEVAGIDNSNGKEIRIYCDVFTGDIYYYTFRTEDDIEE